MFSSLKTLVENQMAQWAQALVGGTAVAAPSRSAAGMESAARLVQSLKNLQNGGKLALASNSSVSLDDSPPETPTDWRNEIAQDNLKSLTLATCRSAKTEALSQNAKCERLAQMLTMALNSGDIALAMMLFSHLETAQANEVTRCLIEKVQALQDNKRKLAQDLQDTKTDAEGSKKMQQIKTEMEQASDDISVLQTFIQEVAQNKQSSVELANGFINKEHETSMAIVRSFGR